jgi:TRAP-type C4-dicarboxylate transport system permease small subunit
MKPLQQGIQQAVGLLLVVMLSAIVALTFTDVMGRRLFNSPVFGANDITEHLMAVIIFAGLPLLTAQRGHLSIDLFDHWLLQPKWRYWHKAVDVLIAAVLALTAWQYFLAIREASEFNEISPALGIPRAWMYIFITATTALAAVLALFAPAPKSATHTEEVAS